MWQNERNLHVDKCFILIKMETRIYSHFLSLTWISHMYNGHFRKKICGLRPELWFLFSFVFQAICILLNCRALNCIHLNVYIKKTIPKVLKKTLRVNIMIFIIKYAWSIFVLHIKPYVLKKILFFYQDSISLCSLI